jgi:hypothetical protein
VHYEKRLLTLLYARLSVCLSFYLSVRMELSCSHWTYFREILFFSIFRESVENNSNFIKIRQILTIVHEDLSTFAIMSRRIFLKIRNIAQGR